MCTNKNPQLFLTAAKREEFTSIQEIDELQLDKLKTSGFTNPPHPPCRLVRSCPDRGIPTQFTEMPQQAARQKLTQHTNNIPSADSG